MAKIYKNANDIVAHSEEVKLALALASADIASDARRILAQHRQTGQSRIVREQGDLDYYIKLVDPDAVSIEFGNFLTSSPVAPLRRAAGLRLSHGKSKGSKRSRASKRRKRKGRRR